MRDSHYVSLFMMRPDTKLLLISSVHTFTHTHVRTVVKGTLFCASFFLSCLHVLYCSEQGSDHVREWRTLSSTATLLKLRIGDFITVKIFSNLRKYLDKTVSRQKNEIIFIIRIQPDT